MASHLRDTAEGRRIAAADSGGPDWRTWGPYLSERAWGTVREYFHGDTGRGVGASHQTGWTALVADLIIRSVTG